MQKDKIAHDAISAWLAPKKEYFEQQKLKEAGGVSVTSAPQAQTAPPTAAPEPQLPNGKIVVDKNNVQTIINGAPSVPSSVVSTNTGNPMQPVQAPLPFGTQHGQNATPDYYAGNQNQFIPRTPTADYVHTANNVGGAVRPPAFGDNNKSVNDLMAKMAGNVGGENHSMMGAPIQNANFIDEYAKTVHSTIVTGFPMYYHWGYIPLDAVKEILKNTEKSLNYEIVMGNENTFIKISNGQKVVETEKFSCK